MLKRSLGSASAFHVHPDFGGLRLLLRRLSSSQPALVCFHVQELKRLLTSRACIDECFVKDEKKKAAATGGAPSGMSWAYEG